MITESWWEDVASFHSELVVYGDSIETTHRIPMLNDTLAQLESRLKTSGALPGDQRAELLDLIQRLKTEIGELSKTHQEQARSIAGYTEVSAHEATRTEKNPELLDHSLQGLSASVAEFESSHPQLVEVVNRISTTLSNMGI